MKNWLGIIFFLILFSCANSVETVPELILDGNYRISKIQGESSLPNGIIFNFNPVGNRVSGRSGCNQFSALYHQEGSKLEFSTPMNTRKYCEGKMEVERQILSSLERASRLEGTGKEMVVYSKENRPLLTLIKID